MSINQYPEWIKCNELNALQSREIIALKERIKRLEEAGDAILNANNDDEEYEAIKHWNKAKEDKL